MSSGNFKLRQQGDPTVHLLEWPKSKPLTTLNAGEVVKQQELYTSLLVRTQNGKDILEDSLAVCNKN